MTGMGTALLSVSIYLSNPAVTQRKQFIMILWLLLVKTAFTVEQRPHPLECDWPLSCVFKATSRWTLSPWNSPPLRWPIWSQAPCTIWGFTPMSSTASAANLSPLRPKQVRPHLARWNRCSSQVGYSGASLSVVSTVTQSKLGELPWFNLWFHACSTRGESLTPLYFRDI